MLHLDKLKNLTANIEKLHSIFKDDNLFLVGGAIRNILLGIEMKPTDLDATGVGEPEQLWNTIDKEKYSCFRTEKYGTITVVPKKEIHYELTPFRAEEDYTDNRHPDVIHRSDSLLKDAMRRDFSINSLYYTQIKTEISRADRIAIACDEKTLIKKLQKDGYIFFKDIQLLIVSNTNIIEKLVVKGEIDPTIITYLLQTAKEIYTFGGNGKKAKNLQILIDPNGGILDILQRKITAIGTPDKRFQEDALRIIRAIRFVSVLNQKLKDKKSKEKVTLFDIDKATRISMKEKYELINNIAKERIKDEITKSFQKGSGFTFVALAEELGLLPLLFPAVAKTKYNDQPVRYHPFDTYSHILLTLYHLEKINKDYLVRLAMLYHDVGKPEQYAAYSPTPKKEEIRSILGGELNHRFSGPKIAKKDFGALGFSKKEIDVIMRYIAEHHTPGEILMAKKDKRKKKLRKLYSDAGFEKVDNLLDITIADRKGQYNPLQNSSDISDVKELRKVLQDLKEKEGQFTKQQLVLNGTDIMQHFDIPAGPQIGELLDKAFIWVANDITTRNDKEVILKYIKTLIK